MEFSSEDQNLLSTAFRLTEFSFLWVWDWGAHLVLFCFILLLTIGQGSFPALRGHSWVIVMWPSHNMVASFLRAGRKISLVSYKIWCNMSKLQETDCIITGWGLIHTQKEVIIRSVHEEARSLGCISESCLPLRASILMCHGYIYS